MKRDSITYKALIEMSMNPKDVFRKNMAMALYLAKDRFVNKECEELRKIFYDNMPAELKYTPQETQEQWFSDFCKEYINDELVPQAIQFVKENQDACSKHLG